MNQAELAEKAPAVAAAPATRASAYLWYAVGILTLISSMQYLDRQVVSILLEPIKHEFQLSDTQLGFLAGTCFAIPFALAGIPLGILADRVSCRKVLGSVLLIWSALTATCGFATSYIYLVLARIGVGAAESPTKPAAISMISDLFPLRQRSTAIGVFWSASSIGTVLAFAFGGYVAARFGWRAAFLIAGLPGVLLAVTFLLTVREPARRGADDKLLAQDTAATPVGRTFRFILSQRSLLLIYGGFIIANTTAAGLTSWLASFLIRVHGMSVQDAGLLYGLASGLTAWIGSIVGGRAADAVARRNVLWVPVVAATAALIAGAVSIAMLFAASTPVIAVLISLWGIALAATSVPIMGLSQSLVGPRMRATATSTAVVAGNLVAFGVGPQLIGFLNDVYTPIFGTEAIRYGMLSLAVFNLLAAWLYLIARPTLKADMQKALQVT